MPHSSGGGSHGGGFHGGSHGGSHGRSGASIRRLSTRPFRGAQKYIYYRNGVPSFFYTNYTVADRNKTPLWLELIIRIPFIFLCFVMFYHSVNIPRALKNTDSEILIEDKAHVLTLDKSSLESCLRSFYAKTGITPAVMTVYNEDWQEDYQNLEKYAYELYVRNFDDEDHWLIVYSQPKHPKAGFTEWYWEGMQGDNTDKILTSKVTSQFNETFQNALLKETRVSLSSSLKEAFYSIDPILMKVTVDWKNLLYPILILVFVGVPLYQSIYTAKKEKEYGDAVPCPAVIREDTCEYCGGVYIISTCTTCPHCGASIKPHTYTVADKELALATMEAKINLPDE